jgi:hypothetical protein
MSAAFHTPQYVWSGFEPWGQNRGRTASPITKPAKTCKNLQLHPESSTRSQFTN